MEEPPCQEEPTWLAQFRRTQELSAQWLRAAGLLLTVLATLLCFVFYMTCRQCLFAVLLFCAVLCPCIHPLNAPLWLAIVLLTVGGWSFTSGSLSVSWDPGLSSVK